jgi:methyltransferase (TIGR00027 family)
MAGEHSVTQTAFGPMVLAAVEQNEPAGRRLVSDDLARSFLPAGLRAVVDATRLAPLRRLMIWGSERAGPGLWANLASRKRFIDERLDEALSEIDAVVVLGAGLDTRAYRLARRGDIPVFEIDLPENVARKRAVVQRAVGAIPPSVHLVAVDFENDDLAAKLVEQGYRSSARTFFIWEGVTQYLTEAAARATLEHLRDAAPGSRLVFTYIRKDFLDGTNMFGAETLYRRFRVRQQMWDFGIQPDDVSEFVSEYGWRLVEQAGPDYIEQNYVGPAGRNLTASQIEWTAYAEKPSP